MIDNRRERILGLTRASLALAISIVCLILFRGPISIVSTFLLPPIIVLFESGKALLYYLLTSMGLFITTLIFFPTQLIFVLTYLILALALMMLRKKRDRKISPFNTLLYLFLTIIALFVGIRLTQLIYMIPLHTMMLRISNNNPLFYFLIILMEAVLVCVFNFGILKLFKSRVRKWYL